MLCRVIFIPRFHLTLHGSCLLYKVIIIASFSSCLHSSGLYINGSLGVFGGLGVGSGDTDQSGNLICIPRPLRFDTNNFLCAREQPRL